MSQTHKGRKWLRTTGGIKQQAAKGHNRRSCNSLKKKKTKKKKLNLKKIDREFFLDCHCISPDSVQDSQHWHKINQMNMYFENITNTTLLRFIHSHTHTFIQWWQRLQCNVPTAHQEQFGVPYVAQGHFYMQLGGARIRTSNLPITRQPTLPPKLQLPQSYHLKEYLVI